MTLRASGPEEVARLEFEGEPRLVAQAREALLASYGFRGAFIEEETTPRDLEIAMQGWQMEKFSPKRE